MGREDYLYLIFTLGAVGAALYLLTERLHTEIVNLLRSYLILSLAVLVVLIVVFLITFSRSDSFQAWVLDKFDSGADTTNRTHRSSWYVRNTLREESRETIRQQVEWVNGIDSKAMKTLRFNVIILGAAVPALSFLLNQEIITDPADITHSFVAAGISFFVLSSALAAVTYTSSSIEVGLGANSVRAVHQEDYATHEFHDTLMNSYSKWIEANRETIQLNSNLISLTILLMVYGIVFSVLGLIEILIDPVRSMTLAGACVLLLVTTLISLAY
ncbi:hypothetical protein ACH9L7_09585 [Haloferax sp. S1W]|uniref:hypothetical protein n=1 Tax=Haloferax sp. S1W TaxID=3377110 RepID=UPI0037C7979B